MKKIISTVLVIFLMILSFGVCGVVSAQSDMFPTEIGIEELEVGDFLEFKLEMSGDDMEMSGNVRMEVTSTSDKINVKGTQYTVLTFSMYGKGTINTEGGITGSFTVTGNMYVDIASEDTVKETSKMTMTMKYEGQTFSMVMESTTILLSKESTWTSEDDPEIGNTWTVTIEEEIEETETTDGPEGKETESDTYTETTVTEYEYVEDDTITTTLGTFNCRVIEEEEEYSYGDYTLNYYDKDNHLPVMAETYESYDLYTEMELIAYRIGGDSAGKSVIGDVASAGQDDKDEDEEEGLLGMGKMGGIDTFLILLIVFIVVIVIILGIFAMRRRRGAEAPSTSTGQQPQQEYTPPGYQTTQAQAPPPPTSPTPPPPPPPPQSYQDTQRYCPSCGQSLNYMQQYQKWYCYTCQRYQ